MKLEYWQSNQHADPTPAADDVMTSQCKPTRPTDTATVTSRCKTLQRVDIRHRANANGEEKVDLDLGL